MVTYIPKREEFLGSDATGTEGSTNRTITLSKSTAYVVQSLIVNGRPLHEGTGKDFTRSGAVITFLSELWNNNIIDVSYMYTIGDTATGSDSLQFTTALKFWKSLHMVKTIRQTGTESYEELGTGDNSNDTFWFDNEGVIEDTYHIYYGSSYTEMIESTHYTVDLDIGKISLTSAGVTLLGTDKLYAGYSYNIGGVLNSETVRILKYSENWVQRKTEMTFTDTSNYNYKQITNELFEGRFDSRYKTFDFYFNPIINLSTTVASDYTTGGTTIDLTSSEGLPDSGTISIGTNKVSYTSISGNTISVPIATPSISADTVVLGECIEISKETEGNTPSYTVLERDTDYKIDFFQGRVELLSNAYFGDLAGTDTLYPSNYMIRTSYFHAWYAKGSTVEVPEDIEQCVFMIATNRLMKSTVGKAHITGLNNFNPSLVAVDRTDIDEIIDYYKQLNVGTSPFNRQSIS